MKQYKLRKELPTFEVGCLFEINGDGDLRFVATADGVRVKTINSAVYNAEQLRRYPNILTEWFEEVLKAKTAWDLKDGDEYYTIFFGKCGDIITRTWEGGQTDDSLRSFGLCFLTVEEAQKEARRLRAKQALLHDTKGFKPNWNDGDWKYTVYYDHDGHELSVDYYNTSQLCTDLWFASQEDAEASIKAHEKEWKIYLWAEE